MKKISNLILNIKTFACMIFIGEIILFMIAKSFLGVYEISFITMIGLVIMAFCISIIRHVLESELVNKKLKRGLVAIIQYILIVATVFAFNAIFQYFVVNATIKYIYLFLFATACYLGGVLGFYIISKLEVDVLNIKLTNYHSK